MSRHPPSASQQGPTSGQAQTFWLQWVQNAFPDLYSRAYFLPPVYFNRVPMTRETGGPLNPLLVLQPVRTSPAPSTAGVAGVPQPPPVHDSDIRDDAAMQRVFVCLQKMSEEKGEVMFGLSQLLFGQYLGEPCYTAAAAQLPLPANLPAALPRNWKQGDFDVLLIHRHHGLVVCEVKSVGDMLTMVNVSQQKMDDIVRKKLNQAVSQLDKAEAMLSHLVSDIVPGLRITKTIAVPNLTALQVQQAIAGDPHLAQDLCRCLGTSDPADLAGLCLCSDQLSDPKTPCDVSSHVLRELGHWWQRRVAGAGPDSHMTRKVYRTLVARFCGPATTVTVPCTCPPRLSVKTLSHLVSVTGECYAAQIALFPEQVHLLNTMPRMVYLSGPPGTGKTVVLLLVVMEWLRCGHHVYIVSVWSESHVACIMLYHLLLQALTTQQIAGVTAVTASHLHLLQYEFEATGGKDVDKAVNELSQAGNGQPLYVIADEMSTDNFVFFFEKLLRQVPRLHLWAASCYHIMIPGAWSSEVLTRPLRCPPVVVREGEKDTDIAQRQFVQPYTQRAIPDHTDGPPVKWLYHRMYQDGHSPTFPADCVRCGREVANFLLHSLRVGRRETLTSTTTPTPPCLQWRDVMVVYWREESNDPKMVMGLRQGGVAARAMKDEDIEDVATARSDVVWVGEGHRMQGLERKVVVCVDLGDSVAARRFRAMSRCTSQLVIVKLGSSQAH